jgi:hypothetical protein
MDIDEIQKQLNLNSLTNKLIQSIINKKSGSASQSQILIHPDILFRYNSINLLVSRRGVGKTFTVMRELIKLSQLPDCGGYTTLLYVTDKTNDETINELIKLIKLKVRQVSYSDIVLVLRDLIDAKNAYADVLEKNALNDLDDETKKDLIQTLDLKKWIPEIPHTAILLDDAINVLKENKFKPLRDILFQNRQPRLTVFICVQDLYGVPPQIRRNCDSVLLFARMNDRLMFGMMMNQLGIKGLVLWEQYKALPFRGILIIDYLPDGIKIKVK